MLHTTSHGTFHNNFMNEVLNLFVFPHHPHLNTAVWQIFDYTHNVETFRQFAAGVTEANSLNAAFKVNQASDHA